MIDLYDGLDESMIWKPQIGETVYHVAEKMNYDRKLYDGSYRIISSEVIRDYVWKRGLCGIESSNGSCYYWKPKDYGKRVFSSPEQAIPYAERLAKEAEGRSWSVNPCERNWNMETQEVFLEVR